ncbi:MAG TPA: hypothetical protein VN815_08440 [Steroidobacteraceae bacterium]|jgi:hypothetical protein|nr:hypothetical protein [Steroidobacteraceae bacterium]
MRTKLTIAHPQAALDRVLDSLARELTHVSDDEILEAARELGMNPLMKGSAAFLGLRIPPVAELADWSEFFASEHFKSALAALEPKHAILPPPLEPEAKPRRPKRPAVIERKQ